jgi:type IV secretion system protein VirB10
VQSKVQNALALAVVALLGGGFLTWYYTGLAAKPVAPEQTKAKQAAQGEMKLPPLGPAPVRPVVKAEQTSALVDAESAEAQVLLAGGADTAGLALAGGPPAGYPPPATYAAPPAPDPVLQRRLEAPVLIRGAGSYAASGSSDPEVGADAALDGHPAGRPQSGFAAGGAARPVSAAGAASSALAEMLQPTRTAAVAAGVMPDRRFLLPKGAFIDCTLETAIDSSLPGMTTCVTATDVWSADGAVVLLERGTKLVGETRGEVRQGQERLFVLWNEARTPAGVIVELASPGTDALGRSGVTGEVDTRFAARFGAAILISLIDAGTAALVAAQSNGGSSVVIAPQGASDVVSEVLRSTVNVPPTIRVAQGGRMQVLVARDVSFADVYALERS